MDNIPAIPRSCIAIWQKPHQTAIQVATAQFIGFTIFGALGDHGWPQVTCREITKGRRDEGTRHRARMQLLFSVFNKLKSYDFYIWDLGEVSTAFFGMMLRLQCLFLFVSPSSAYLVVPESRHPRYPSYNVPPHWKSASRHSSERDFGDFKLEMSVLNPSNLAQKLFELQTFGQFRNSFTSVS